MNKLRDWQELETSLEIEKECIRLRAGIDKLDQATRQGQEWILQGRPQAKIDKLEGVNNGE